MRHLALTVTVVVIGTFAATAAWAQRAEQVSFQIEAHSQDAFWTDRCGLPVVIDIVADWHITLVYNGDGLVVRELDRSSRGYLAYSAPSTGKTITIRAQAFRVDYPGGASLGSPAIVSVTGLAGHIPGVLAPDAGLGRFAATVNGFDQFGIPELAFAIPIMEVGRRSEPEEIAVAICQALADP